MGKLSNLLRLGRISSAAPIVVRRAALHEVEPAVRLIAGPGSSRFESAPLRELERIAAAQVSDPCGLLIAERGSRLVGAILPVVSPGRTMLLFPQPGLSGEADRAVAGMLIRQACGDGAAAGVHLAQVLVEPGRHDALSLLAECGFARLAELLYMQAPMRRPVSPPLLPAEWRWVTYDDGSHALFAHAILASYEQSLDCPGLNGMRHTDDIIAGHRATGRHDPALWRVLCEGDRALAVLLLAPLPHVDAMELAYLGIAPAQRGRGLGDLLMRAAAASACEAGCARLTLAVDAGNLPALRLYWRHGMQAIGRKVAMLRDLRAAAAE